MREEGGAEAWGKIYLFIYLIKYFFVVVEKKFRDKLVEGAGEGGTRGEAEGGSKFFFLKKYKIRGRLVECGRWKMEGGGG